MPTIVGLSGSLRQGSLNAALLRAAAELTPSDLTIDIATIRGIPLYDGDVEAQGMPQAVLDLKERIVKADGLLLVTPEYNNSIPGVFKNAIDWLSRPASDAARIFGNRRIGLIGVTPGRGMTMFAQTAWLPIFRTLGTRPYFGKTLYIGGAAKLFDAQGTLTDADTRTRVKDYLTGFLEFLRS